MSRDGLEHHSLLVDAWGERADVLEGIYWYAADHHQGQWERWYRILTAAGRVFKPSRLSKRPDSERGQEIYALLEGRNRRRCENLRHQRNLKKAGEPQGYIATVWQLRGRGNFIDGDSESWCAVCRKLDQKRLARDGGKEVNTKERDRIFAKKQMRRRRFGS